LCAFFIFTVIKAEHLSHENVSKGYALLDKEDDLSNYEGENTQIMIPSNLLQNITCKSLYIAKATYEDYHCMAINR